MNLAQLALFLLPFAPALTAQQHFVYFLAGQSNTALLSQGTPDASLQLSNVTYHHPPFGGSSGTAAEPLMRIGHALGQFHGTTNTVDVFQLAVGASTLTKQYAPTGSVGYWWPNDNGMNPPAILSFWVAWFTSNPITIDYLGIIWGQGENDMMGGSPQDVYTANANEVFNTFSGLFGVPTDVFLVTPGAIDASCAGPAVTNADADSIRDAFNALHDQVAPVLPTRIVAHHYDLLHTTCPATPTVPDTFHLSFSSYIELGQRIADGITSGGSAYFDVVASNVVSQTIIDLVTSTPGATPPTASTAMFQTVVAPASAGTPTLTSVTLSPAGDLRLTYSNVNFANASSISVRYAPGAGSATAWPNQLVKSSTGIRLAPRFVRVL